MKAIVCHEFGAIDQLQYEDVDAPKPNADEVLVDIRATSVNFPDALMVQGLYQVKPPCPFSPGMEIAGTVAALGDNVTQFKVGDRIVATCSTGGYAEQVCVTEQGTFALPAAISDSEAAALLVAYGTAHHALKQRAQLQQGETLLVLGASGGTGLAAVQMGKAMGATVIAACSTEEKLATAQSHGADHLINYQTADLKTQLKQLTKGKGVDVVYDPVGGEAFDSCSRSMAWNGRLLVIGFASGTIPKLPINLALVKGYSLVGVFWGVFTAKEPEVYAENMKELFAWIESDVFRPVIDSEVPLSEALTALKKVTQREVQGKIILKPGS
jgi:NADPH:quinone reductase